MGKFRREVFFGTPCSYTKTWAMSILLFKPYLSCLPSTTFAGGSQCDLDQTLKLTRLWETHQVWPKWRGGEVKQIAGGLEKWKTQLTLNCSTPSLLHFPTPAQLFYEIFSLVGFRS